jgi:GH24 family phage-related lysozyme (muramidase)
MSINKIAPTKRGKAALAAVLMSALAGVYGVYDSSARTVAIDGKPVPVEVVLAVEKLIKLWESLILKSHWDQFGKVWDICYGETKGIRPGMTKTKRQCEEMLYRRVVKDFYEPQLRAVPRLKDAPDTVKASMISGAYNFGVGGWAKSTAAKMIAMGKWQKACEAQTMFNKAGGRVLRGLVNRREMGDASRLGEAELCVSGLPSQVHQ